LDETDLTDKNNDTCLISNCITMSEDSNTTDDTSTTQLPGMDTLPAGAVGHSGACGQVQFELEVLPALSRKLRRDLRRKNRKPKLPQLDGNNDTSSSEDDNFDDDDDDDDNNDEEKEDGEEEGEEEVSFLFVFYNYVAKTFIYTHIALML